MKDYKVNKLQKNIRQTVLILETSDMHPLNFWIHDVNNYDLQEIVKKNLSTLQKERKVKLTQNPVNGKLCIGNGFGTIVLDKPSYTVF